MVNDQAPLDELFQIGCDICPLWLLKAEDVLIMVALFRIDNLTWDQKVKSGANAPHVSHVCNVLLVFKDFGSNEDAINGTNFLILWDMTHAINQLPERHILNSHFERVLINSDFHKPSSHPHILWTKVFENQAFVMQTIQLINQLHRDIQDLCVRQMHPVML